MEAPPLPVLGSGFLLPLYKNVHPASEHSFQHGIGAILKHLESEGDAVHIQSLLFDLLGSVNRAFAHEVKLVAMSNENFAHITLIICLICYELNTLIV